MVQVLLFHAWHIGSPIGVDAFIMISAFLMTGSFVRRAEAGRIPFFLERWANTFKRLLPPLVVTVLGTLIASYFFLPPNRWGEVAVQGFASVTYWENWRLVKVAADYYADNHALSSPFQHLWSMSMQGQIFLLWPLIMTACALLAKGLRRRVRPIIFYAFLLLTVVSLAWLLFWAPQDGSVYFDTRARVWEFSFGSAIAAVPTYPTYRPSLARLLSWVGLVVLVVYGLVSIGTYPGPMAAVPMLAVSMVLVFDSKGDRFGVSRVLSAPPLVWLGNMSYSVYLVHWPIFVFYLNARGRSALGLGEGLVAIAASLAVAFLLTRIIDDPIRNWSWANRSSSRKGLVVIGSLSIAIVPLTLVEVGLDRMRAQEMISDSGAGSTEHPGARVLLGTGEIGYSEEPIPGPLSLDAEWAHWTDLCSGKGEELFEGGNSSCRSKESSPGAPIDVIVGGDSHVLQMILPQIEPLLDSHGWNAQAVLKGACSWGMPEAYNGDCREHNERLLEYVEASQPEIVFLITTSTLADSNEENLRPGVEELVKRLTSEGILVVGVRDNLRSTQNLFECSSERDPNEFIGGCMLERSRHLAPEDPSQTLVGIPGFYAIDMTDAYCLDDVCPTIIGNIKVYLDNNHLTKSYSSTVAPFFVRRVNEALGLG